MFFPLHKETIIKALELRIGCEPTYEHQATTGMVKMMDSSLRINFFTLPVCLQMAQQSIVTSAVRHAFEPVVLTILLHSEGEHFKRAF
jgi:hypothetical protein